MKKRNHRNTVRKGSYPLRASSIRIEEDSLVFDAPGKAKDAIDHFLKPRAFEENGKRFLLNGKGDCKRKVFSASFTLPWGIPGRRRIVLPERKPVFTDRQGRSFRRGSLRNFRCSPSPTFLDRETAKAGGFGCGALPCKRQPRTYPQVCGELRASLDLLHHNPLALITALAPPGTFCIP